MTRPTPPAQDLYADAVGIGINPSWLAQFLGVLETMTKEGYWESNQYHGTNQIEKFMKFLCEGALPPMIIGQIIMLPTESNIPEWLLPCDGRILSGYEYPDLRNALSEAYWFLESSNFRIPDFRGRAPFGVGTGTAGNLSIAQEGGSQTVNLGINNIPEHNHNVAVNSPSLTATGLIAAGGAQTGTGFGVLTAQSGTRWQVGTMANVGGGQAHENMPPYHTIGFYIVAKYPS